MYLIVIRALLKRSFGQLSARRMRWAGHVAQVARRGMHIGYCWESQKERDH
jgi:hypothetical protein